MTTPSPDTQAILARLEKLEEFARQRPTDSFAHYGLAMEYANAGRDDDALAAFQKLLGFNPNYTVAYYHAGQLLARMGRADEAREMFERGMEVAARDGDLHTHSELEQALHDLANDEENKKTRWPSIQAGDRVVKVRDGRAIPIGTKGTVEWAAGMWVAVDWEGGYGKMAVKYDDVKLHGSETIVNAGATGENKVGPEDTSAKQTLAEQAVELLSGLVTISVLISVLWIGLSFLLPFWKASPEDLSRLSGASAAVQIELYTWIPNVEFRLEPHGGDNLEIYLSQYHFESVPYPDRKKFVSSVGQSWCSRVSGDLLPSVKFYDMRSGQRLASYSCTLSSTWRY